MLRIILTFGLVTIALAQIAQFEVATVKRSQPPIRWSGFQISGPGRFEASHVTVKAMIAYANEVQSFNIEGGPGWAFSEEFDIAAAMDTAASPAQTREMLKNLLAERFALKVRRGTKRTSVFDLAIDKIVKIKPSPLESGYLRSLKPGVLEGHGTTMPELARFLQTLLGEQVTDRTGLAGMYDFELNWAPDESQAGRPGAGKSQTPVTEDSRPSLFTALQEQLGLKLVSTQGNIDTVLIERVEAPSAN